MTTTETRQPVKRKLPSTTGQSTASNALPQAGSTSALFDLVRLRSARGVSQKAVAARLGLCPSGVSRYEGARNPRVGTLRKFIAATGGELLLVALYVDADGTTARYLIRPRG
jgi:Helix-turn-helix domain